MLASITWLASYPGAAGMRSRPCGTQGDRTSTVSSDEKVVLRIQSKALSKKAPVPLGTSEPDPERPGRLRVFGYVPELSQMLRVVVEPVGADTWEVVTIFPDRSAARRRAR